MKIFLLGENASHKTTTNLVGQNAVTEKCIHLNVHYFLSDQIHNKDRGDRDRVLHYHFLALMLIAWQ